MRILVCIDLSPLTDRVAAEGSALARATGAQVTLVHAALTEPVLSSGGANCPQGHRVPPLDMAERRAQMGALVERLRGEGVEVEGRVELSDDIVAELLRAIDAIGATYVVIGSHGHGRVFELLLGSVTQGVIRHARIPVIVVPARE